MRSRVHDRRSDIKIDSFLGTSNEHLENEIKNCNKKCLKIKKRIKCLGISVTREICGLYTENYKALW